MCIYFLVKTLFFKKMIFFQNSLLRENLEAAGQKLPRAFAIADVSKLYSNTTSTTTSSKSTTTTSIKPSNERTTHNEKIASSSTADGAGAIVHAPSGSLPSVLSSSSGTSHRPSLLSNTVVDAMLDNDNDALPSSVLELAARVTNFENDNESTDDNDDSSSEEEARVETLQ